LAPSAVVIVATVRALKMNGGVSKTNLASEDVEAVQRGSVNLVRHIENIRQFGVPSVVAVNHFTTDTDAEIAAIREVAAQHGCKAVVCHHWADGGKGAEALAHEVAALADSNTAQFAPIYDQHETLFDKMNIIATRIYRASAAVAEPSVLRQLADWEKAGYGHLPVCMAKTQYSFSTDPTALGAPTGHIVPVREVRLSAGAGFVVAVCGEIMTMPGLPKIPAAEGIGIDADGTISGLF
jgi:formate--tetrahydrofolate ligase